MGHTLDARGKPAYNDDATNPGPQGDFQAAADWADRVGAGVRGTASERSLLTASGIAVGQFFTETDTGAVYKRSSTGWDLVWNDTGWMNLQLAAGWTAESGDTPQWRLRAGIVYFRGRLNATTGAGTNPFTNPLPAEARPSREHPVLVGVTGGSGKTYVMNVAPNGVTFIYKGSDAVLNLSLYGFTPMPVV